MFSLKFVSHSIENTLLKRIKLKTPFDASTLIQRWTSQLEPISCIETFSRQYISRLFFLSRSLSLYLSLPPPPPPSLARSLSLSFSLSFSSSASLEKIDYSQDDMLGLRDKAVTFGAPNWRVEVDWARAGCTRRTSIKIDVYYTIRPFKRTPGTKVEWQSLKVSTFDKLVSSHPTFFCQVLTNLCQVIQFWQICVKSSETSSTKRTSAARMVDRRLPGKGNSKFHGARPVY